MTDTLVPVTEWSADDLSKQVMNLVAENEQLLRQRYLVGVLRRYGEKAANPIGSIENAQHNHEDGALQAFTVISETGKLAGMATIYPDLQLTRLRLPIPRGVSDQVAEVSTIGKLNVRRSTQIVARLLKQNETFLPFANPNVFAWTGSSHKKYLSLAYRGLMARVRDLPHQQAGLQPYTIEPNRSPAWVHTSIVLAKLLPIARGWFDDQESRRLSPPRSTLYTTLAGTSWRRETDTR